METLITSSKKRRLRRKTKQTELKQGLGDYKSRSEQNLGIRKIMSKKKERKRVRKIKEQNLGFFIQDLYKKHIPLNHSQDQVLIEYEHHRMNPFEQTVDLSDAETLVDNSNPTASLLSSCEVKKKSEPVIDLCQDLTDRKEVIDLTETIKVPRFDCDANGISEPTIIDISEDDSKDDNNFKAENDEIFVIGTFNKTSNLKKKSELSPFISLSSRWNNLNSLISCSKKLKKKYKKRLVLDKIDNKNVNKFKRNFGEIKDSSDKASKLTKVGENIYVNSPLTLPSKGLRPIIIDGSNVAFVHSNCNFSCKRLEICINYFKEKGHKVTAFVPQFRISSHRSDNPQLLRKLERQGDVVLTPSKKVDGRYIVPYDDRFIVQTAVLKGGIIVSRDNFNDLLKENPAWAETIKYRTLAFTWVDDVLMFPKDPLGEHGPTLEDFLRFH